MKVLKLDISTCSECPHLAWTGSNTNFFCNKYGMEIAKRIGGASTLDGEPKPEFIPEWCPLPNTTESE